MCKTVFVSNFSLSSRSFSGDLPPAGDWDRPDRAAEPLDAAFLQRRPPEQPHQPPGVPPHHRGQPRHNGEGLTLVVQCESLVGSTVFVSRVDGEFSSPQQTSSLWILQAGRTVLGKRKRRIFLLSSDGLFLHLLVHSPFQFHHVISVTSPDLRTRMCF